MKEKIIPFRRLLPFILLAMLGFALIALQLFAGIDLPSLLRDAFNLKFLPRLDSGASYGLLLLFGLLASFHCMGMCGGLMLSQCISANEAQRTGRPAVMRAGAYNLGRVVSYTAVGAVTGGVGQMLSLSPFLKGVIPILGGVFMILMVVNQLGVFPALRRLNIGMPKFLAKKLLRGSIYGPLSTGLLTGLMPCGPLQTVELYSLSTRSALAGALAMLLFSLGTVPGMFALGNLGAFGGKRFTRFVTRAGALLVMVLGVLMIGRGLALEGVDVTGPFIAKQSGPGIATAVVRGDRQTVTTTIGENSFPPIRVRQGIRVVWTIKVKKADYNDCNKAMVIPAYNISKSFQVGDNVVEFVPQKAGEFPYTCWMGMIKSKIIVEPNDAYPAAGQPTASAANSLSAANTSSGTQCSAGTASGGSSAVCCSSAAQKSSSHVPAPSSAPASSAIGQTASSACTSSAVCGSEQKFEGYIIDTDCLPLYPDPADETRGCLSMRSCAQSGYGIAITGQGGTVFYLFDGYALSAGKPAGGGQKLAADFIAGNITDQNVRVNVCGALTGQKQTPPGGGSAYEVLRVTSIQLKP